tara:strand:+ start:643 stop:1104 length:462 start_codon:yes stop_codon:yes gene_type:complete
MPAVSKKQQKFFGIVRAVQKGEMAPTTPETAKAASDMKKSDVKKFASTKHKGLPEKKKIEEDKQIKKIVKQLRKSVKSHEKQADTLEKKIEEQLSYQHFIKKAKQSSEKMKQDKERNREMAAASAYKDKKGKGIKFYDKKGSGRMKDGKKVYD